jgi:hypothetical protein
MVPPPRAMAVSPLSTRPSVNSATSVTSSEVAGSTTPHTPSIRAAISTAWVKSRVTSVSAAISRLPIAWPFSPSPVSKRY